MKSILTKILLTSLTIISIIFVLNLNVTMRQGINYEVHTIRIPLYLKLLDFFDRHYNYKQLVNRITNNSKTKEESVMLLFKWTYKNIKRIPVGFPIVDDHVWNVIVRGYGVRDQFSDVFSTLCNYAGADAFFSGIYAKNSEEEMIFSFVRIDGRWFVYDPYHGVYFKNKYGSLASMDDIKGGNWIIETISKTQKIDIDYKPYLENLPLITEIGLRRANMQSPLRRFIFEARKWLKLK